MVGRAGNSWKSLPTFCWIRQKRTSDFVQFHEVQNPGLFLGNMPKMFVKFNKDFFKTLSILTSKKSWLKIVHFDDVKSYVKHAQKNQIKFVKIVDKK